ncbi:MAG: cytochrome c3 family protein [Candidatus Poribacteria bacterium]
MTAQVEKTLVIVFLIVFSTLGILGYTIRDAEPKKIALPSQAGTVIFDHVIHVEQELDCDLCHHTIKEETEKPKPCERCHNAQKKGSDIAPSDAFHGSCGECHDEVQDNESCNMCHKNK